MSDTIPSGFKRKVLKLDKSPFETPKIEAPQPSKKRIVPTKSSSTFRDKHREIYLPILIQVFELRGKIDQLKNPDPLSEQRDSAEQIHKRLEALEADILEAQRWCDGVILQLRKAKDEAKSLIPEKEPEVSLWDRFKRWLPW